MQGLVGQEVQPMPVSLEQVHTQKKYAGPQGGARKNEKSLLMNSKPEVPSQLQNGQLDASEGITGWH